MKKPSEAVKSLVFGRIALEGYPQMTQMDADVMHCFYLRSICVICG